MQLRVHVHVHAHMVLVDNCRFPIIMSKIIMPSIMVQLHSEVDQQEC